MTIAGRDAARHGVAEPRGQHLLAGSRGGRFGRMFPFLPERDPGDDAISELVRFLEAGGSRSDEGHIPAGYTYLGQFVDHDITFDPTSRLRRDNDPQALVNFRTPRLDLDSLYGSGPADQPFLYDWDVEDHPGVQLLVDRPRDPCLAPMDLPRNARGRALIGDARNDENLIVAQLHLLFIRFHNAVVCWLAATPEWHASAKRRITGELLEEARRIVRWHYQWIVVHDFLQRIAGETMARSVLHDDVDGAAPHVTRRFFHFSGEPALPVEFSGAAYRFGHSMVRDSYNVNAHVSAKLFPGALSHHEDHLSGFRRLPSDLEIQWKRFFFAGFSGNLSFRIDRYIVPSLFSLPHAAAPLSKKLPLLNLERGRAFGLPSGRDVAHAMSVEPLPYDDILPPAATPNPISDPSRAALLRATPLWLYILAEAEKAGEDGGGGVRLGPVGGRIVAEVLVGLLEADPHSYLRQWPTWKPGIDKTMANFTMLDLLAFVDEHEPKP